LAQHLIHSSFSALHTRTPLPPASFSYTYTPPRDLHSFPTRRSSDLPPRRHRPHRAQDHRRHLRRARRTRRRGVQRQGPVAVCARSEEHTSELQSRGHLVCRLLLEKKKQNNEDGV